jgi:hypothetical protein
MNLITETIARSKDPNMIEPIFLNDLQILLKIGDFGSPY